RRWLRSRSKVMARPRWRYTVQMTRTDKKVWYLPIGKVRPMAKAKKKAQKSTYPGITPRVASAGVQAALKVLEGRWKLTILFELFNGKTLRFSELERAIPGITQKMLIQQLRDLERHGVVRRIVYPVVPPKVEYTL